jgi:uncharacterized phage-associated protein
MKDNVDQFISVSCPVDELAVAAWFILKAKAENKNLTGKKLQLLVLFAYGKYFVDYGVKLFDAMPLAQWCGPVLPRLVVFYKDAMDVCSDDTVRVFDHGELKTVHFQLRRSEDELQTLPEETQQQHLQFMEQIERVLSFVWKEYNFTDDHIFNHYLCSPKTPWYKIWEQSKERDAIIYISHKAIQDYFCELYGKTQKNTLKKNHWFDSILQVILCLFKNKKIKPQS